MEDLTPKKIDAFSSLDGNIYKTSDEAFDANIMHVTEDAVYRLASLDRFDNIPAQTTVGFIIELARREPEILYVLIEHTQTIER